MTLEERAKEYAENIPIPFVSADISTKIINAIKQAHIDGAESRKPEIDYGKELIRDILISINGTFSCDISEDSKELLKEAVLYVGGTLEVGKCRS